MRITDLILASLALLQIADAVLTVKIIARGGRELNMLMHALMCWIGLVPALVVAKAGVLAVLLVARWCGAWGYTLGHVVLLAINGGYLWVVWHNLRVWRRMDNGA